ncbi:MAG: M60 family metallopeptidase, partial [Planctomycetes bacterium]|nr:M60 family metallopeptidase [Planctomycetota bacterium]
RLERMFKDKVTWKDWGKKPFEGLIMYELIIRDFGWDVIKKTFAEYRDLKDSERPKSDLDKRSQWLTRLSKHVGRDLGPYFDAFGVETSQAAKDSIAALPKWMPKEVESLLKQYPR